MRSAGEGWEAAGADAGAGAGAAASAGDAAAGTGVGALPYVIAPVSRLTSFSAAVLPAKNSPAESAGSDEGAGG